MRELHDNLTRIKIMREEEAMKATATENKDNSPKKEQVELSQEQQEII